MLDCSSQTRLADVLARVLDAARAHVDTEMATMTAAVALLEKAERERVINRWPDARDRWRSLASEDFQRLADFLGLLEQGQIVTGADNERYLTLPKAPSLS